LLFRPLRDARGYGLAIRTQDEVVWFGTIMRLALKFKYKSPKLRVFQFLYRHPTNEGAANELRTLSA
jgi:hypothetical protein